MDCKLVLIVVCVLAAMMAEPIAADFFYNRPSPSIDSLDELGLKCVPGRTIIKITEPQHLMDEEEPDSSYESDLRIGTRRKHMTAPTKDEHCRICTCSVEGKDEYCSNRPAMNVNECLMMKELMTRFNASMPFEHEKSLASRIRRDYIWHDDEIPYEAKAACRRGHSYYSNSISANETDIDVGTDIESLLDYANSGVCFYCVCAVHGREVGCMSRNPWFCEYYRFLRTENAGRDIYMNMFEQDRPRYFSLLSYRLRRTMDDGIFDFMNSVDDEEDQKKCVPFVSQYTDCTDENICSGCTRCLCSAQGQWVCDNVHECDEEDQADNVIEVDDQLIENALKTVQSELKKKRIRDAKRSNNPLVPNPMKKTDRDTLLDEFRIYDPLQEIMSSLRLKRSIKQESKAAKTNETIKFFGVVDELNEDTLKTSNISGTLQAQKVDSVNLPNLSRRTGVLDNTNTSLQIEFSEPNLYNHITDNKIDITSHNDVIFDDAREKLQLIGNTTQETKNKELSKLVVNELKKSSEIIGDSAAPVISNITFTPENDTFSAMAFIAGNLLNKLWNIEKDASGTSIETEVIKHEKIANLLELFKEPLTLKQETFLKNALAQLSSVVDKNKDNIRNISICENIEEAKKFLDDSAKSGEENFADEQRKGCKNSEKKNEETVDAISKVNDVMALIQKFDGIQNKISNLEKEAESDLKPEDKVSSSTLKKYSSDSVSKKGEKTSLNQFQVLLAKITGILYPKDSPNKVKNPNSYGTSDNIKDKLKSLYDIDLNNINVTSKDKIIFDYLSHIEANPECLLKANNQKTKAKTLANIEGNILLNLSEFFKIKSFSDLVKILEPKKEQTVHKAITTTEKLVETTTEVEKVTKSNNVKKSLTLETTKERLKAHLKTILEDLIEIQNARGVNTKNINLVDALPCIYKILNADKEIPATKTKDIDPSDKVATIFNELKTDLKSTQTRRSGIITGPRPKSAVVWERIIKALNEKPKSKTRRTSSTKTRKSFEEIKRMTEKIESSGSNTYKNYALLVDVPAADKLVLLKTLEADVRTYIKALENIRLSIDSLDKLTPDKQLELIEFISNSATHLNLDDKVVDNLNKPKQRRFFVAEKNSSRDTVKTQSNKIKQALRTSEVTTNEGTSNDNGRLSRDLIINQLIKNRVQLYIKLKEAKGINLEDDMNYNIAQKISILLDTGNYQLARELYKVFVTQNINQSNLDQVSSSSNSNSNRYSGSNLLNLKEDFIPTSIQQKRPLIQFEEPKTQDNSLKWFSNDNLIKQLLNIKSMSG